MKRPARTRNEILFEGHTKGELLGLPPEQIEALFLSGQPIVFRAGSATILGSFRRDCERLVIDLAHVDGGGEGVLQSLSALAERYAKLHGVEEIEWIVRAVNCEKPNLKLRRVLQRRGFEVRAIDDCGEAFYRIQAVPFDKPTKSSPSAARTRMGE